ncbi:hypothetical protein Aam_162_001 [Acidocella aminolytica 101 = DSM 11237]|uniref:Uncharacterized protein n=1 Tax=Acidocella aminolytica 101 = DSM 11237 TaxID=1120923 RepID=A0A0D6PKE4_9PROT|nr:hypothetical protein Aam_162_001 [Acidocella aminolytica 101 = DSM 11237]GBQ41745.1 hypothetical protein AA11237_2781 [Acidocella aminolytica 101 = DSM 11237]
MIDAGKDQVAISYALKHKGGILTNSQIYASKPLLSGNNAAVNRRSAADHAKRYKVALICRLRII